MNASCQFSSSVNPASLAVFIAVIASLTYALQSSAAPSTTFPEPLKIALAPRPGPIFQYHVNFRNNEISGSAHVDPSQPAGKR